MGKRVPFRLQVTVTDSCNLRCKTCYQAKPDESPHAPQHMDAALFEKVVAEVNDFAKKEQMVVEVGLSGGEPFLHPQINDLIRTAYRITENPVSIATNGTISDAVLQTACNLATQIHHIQVSIDGPQDIHDSIRGAGSFQQAITTIQKLKKQGATKVHAKHVMTRNSIARMKDFFTVMQSLALDQLIVRRLVPSGRGEQFKDELLNPMEVQAAFQEINILAENTSVPLGHGGTLWCLLDPLLGSWASGGMALAAVDPDGTLLAEATLPLPLGNLTTDDFAEIWYNHDILRKIRFEISPHCSNCPHFQNCRGWRSLAYAVWGDVTAPDPQCWRVFDENFRIRSNTNADKQLR